jgi:hypothetical protein
MSKPDLSTYGGRLRDLGYAGELVDQNYGRIISKTNEGATAIDFGVAVARGAADATCKAPAADTDEIIGIAVRHAIRPASGDGNNTVNYAQYDTVPVLEEGYIYAVPSENVTRGDKVVNITATNKLGTAAIAAAAARAAKAGNTGDGVMTLDATTPVLSGAQLGVYKAVCITAASNGGTFRVSDPLGNVLGDVAVGATFANQIKFAIADGSADFIVGDEIDVTVSGRVVVPRATWETSTTANTVGIVKINR